MNAEFDEIYENVCYENKASMIVSVTVALLVVILVSAMIWRVLGYLENVSYQREAARKRRRTIVRFHGSHQII